MNNQAPMAITLDSTKMYGAIAIALFVFIWSINNRVGYIEVEDKHQREERAETRNILREVLSEIKQIQTSRFTPADFASNISPLTARVGTVETENEKQWSEISDIDSSVRELNINIERLLIKMENFGRDT